MAQKQKQGRGSAKHGRNKDKCAAYRHGDRRFRNKYRRVLRSNGKAEAERWVLAYRARERGESPASLLSIPL